MSKVFIDANILLDILIPDRKNHQKALLSYEYICNHFTTLATSENIITTIEYIASRNKIPCKVVNDFFQRLYQTFELYTFTEVLSSSLEIYSQYCLKKKKIDFEDLLQIQCAIFHNCDAFLTEDKQIPKMGLNIEVLNLEDTLL
jgi:predicted nucleic acid-binding protein